ncbi:MAG: FAD-binding and (Fe-S)-binding domain-containing protein [Bacteroidota bacterium]
MSSLYPQLLRRLATFLPPDRVITDPLRTLAYGTDASFYSLIPQVVVKVETEPEVLRLLSAAREAKTALTFRAAGTSLSGQAVTDAVLGMLGGGWKGYDIAPDGGVIRLQPGVVGARANVLLAPWRRKIGPDPASINAAMIGGIAANNASGMCCGTAQNSYKTLAGMRVIFADGSVLDTLDPGSREGFLHGRSDLVEGINNLGSRIRADPGLSERIRRKFSMKNTTGYSLNALVDFTDPVEIIQHLMIGSEGTLGFIAEVAYRTVPDHPHKATTLLLYPDIASACTAVPILKTLSVDAVELMDRASLRSVEAKEGMPSFLRDLGPDVAALLVETRAEHPDALRRSIAEIMSALTGTSLLSPPAFTEDPEEGARLWNIRKGLFPSVGAMRRTGTTCIIEDVAFPVRRLAEATLDLRQLFGRHGYDDAIIFGHALEGNLHFVFNQDFNDQGETRRYAGFMDELTKMVVGKYDGSLKAEHGTGRNMAPFVELEWGEQAYSLMKEIKTLFDPSGLLNPGVILNTDRSVHLKNLKPLPAADPIIDKCIECGFCEVQCPSRDLTLTPRHRIVIYREISRLKDEGKDSRRLRRLERGYAYAGDETCATDGLCALACPVGIDTGKMIKRLRAANRSPAAHLVASLIARHMGGVTAGLRMALNTAAAVRSVAGDRLMEMGSGLARRVTFNRSPAWNRAMPRGAKRIRSHEVNDNGRPTVVYFPSCITRTFGASPHDGTEPDVTESTIAVLERAGYRVVIPEGVDRLCCGMAFDSKGFPEEGREKAAELADVLEVATHEGEYPVLMDMSPCLYRMKELSGSRLKLFDPAEFVLKFLAKRLEFRRLDETVAVHVTCSATKMGLGGALEKVARMCASEVVVPPDVGCCGWAGDRGFTHPELNASALARLKEAIPEDCTAGYSTSRTCEIGLTLHSGIRYASIMSLVDRCTRAKEGV